MSGVANQSSVGSAQNANGGATKTFVAEDAAPTYEAAFHAVLNNRNRERSRGFAVVVPGARSLRPLQDACFRQTWNSCLTARYRLERAPLFGTLLEAFMRDINQYRGKRKHRSLSGEFVHAPIWDDWLPIFAGRLASEGALPDKRGSISRSADSGVLRSDVLEAFLDVLDREDVLRTGQRIVLLAELEGETAYEELTLAFQHLLERLPTRMGIVVSGASEGYRPPVEDPHVLVLHDIPDAPPGKAGFRYAPSALRGDQPAKRDLLGFDDYADAMAQLVLLPETSPLTVGIHGPWGKGKSSFMKLVSEKLVALAPSNAATTGDSVPLAARLQLYYSSIQEASEELNRQTALGGLAADVKVLRAQLDKQERRGTDCGKKCSARHAARW